jgi:predicted metal-binding membrane protein
MESATVRRSTPFNGPAEVGLVASLILLAVAAWILSDERMAGMDAGPGTDLGGFGWFAVIWVTMMAAMMFPSMAPAALAYARVQEEDRHGGGTVPRGATALFTAGYLVPWAAVGVLGYLLIEGVRSLEIGFLAWDEAGSYVAGGAILGAALYQLTPLKTACLRECRHPQRFLRATHADPAGALLTGIEHGSFCVGCCWALMVVLFALGVMSIGWMALVAAFIAAEKLLPRRALASGSVAIVLVALGLAVAFAPEDVPGLTIPGSPEAMEAMEAMGMEPGGAMEEMEMEPDGGAMEGSGMERGGAAMEGEAMERDGAMEGMGGN